MSPIVPERCIGARDLTEPRLSPDGTMLGFAVSDAGVAVLMLSRLDGTVPIELTAHPLPRTGRGLGGGCWCWSPDSSSIVYSAVDGNLWLQPVPGGPPRCLTDQGPDRVAQAPAIAPDGSAVVYVVDQAEVWLQPLSAGSPRRIDSGSADFCFDPQFRSDSSGAFWQAWNVPHMPWDNARLDGVMFDGSVGFTMAPDGALQQPRCAADGTLMCVRDDHGWSNVWLGDAALVGETFEHAGPTWGLGQRSFVMSPDGKQVAFTRNDRGFGRLCVLELAVGVVTDVGRAVHGQLSWHGNRLAALRTGARTPTQVVVYETTTWQRSVVDIGPNSWWNDELLVEPEAHVIAASDSATLHARLYRADGPTDRLICWLHGGPTDQWQVGFMPRVAYWRSRGWNVLLADHRGSTGHGRAYQQSMNHRWGILDVSDTASILTAAHERGWGSPQRTVLMGGSAGGFTVLGVLAEAPQLAAAAVVSYPVTDLFDLAERSHRFERHYTHSLVGPLPARHDEQGDYFLRSPVNFADRIRTPLLMFHGDADAVVPVEQSRAMATRIVESGGMVELCVYTGEGHGFRLPANQLDEYRRTGDFIAEHVQ